MIITGKNHLFTSEKNKAGDINFNIEIEDNYPELVDGAYDIYSNFERGFFKIINQEVKNYGKDITMIVNEKYSVIRENNLCQIENGVVKPIKIRRIICFISKYADQAVYEKFMTMLDNVLSSEALKGYEIDLSLYNETKAIDEYLFNDDGASIERYKHLVSFLFKEKITALKSYTETEEIEHGLGH